MAPDNRDAGALARRHAIAIALTLASWPAAAQISAATLGDFIIANQASIPEGRQSMLPNQWCFATSGDPHVKRMGLHRPAYQANNDGHRPGGI